MVSLPTLDTLDGLTIPTACPVAWDSMQGDERTRFCDTCSQNVHDVSELTRDEALRLVAADRPLPCLRIYRRPDGRVMTADCATRRGRAWKWLHHLSPWATTVFGLVAYAGWNLSCTTGIPAQCVRPHSDEAVQSVVGAAAVVGANHGD
ncbi:hypothetical protein J0H58_37025 [bacterium]|nr:hypothetical protein [bacterium]